MKLIIPFQYIYKVSNRRYLINCLLIYKSLHLVPWQLLIDNYELIKFLFSEEIQAIINYIRFILQILNNHVW